MDLSEKLYDWMPVRVYPDDGRYFVDWCWMGDARFIEPFFDLTIEKRMRLPFNLAFRHRTPVETLKEVDRGLDPTGFIFHMSRCGSTLVSQMLAAVGSNIVISEAPPVDNVIRSAAGRDKRIEMLRDLVGAYARPRNGERHFFIKFDSWSTLDLDLVEEAFPNVPWVFLYREPVEVIASHMIKRGSQMVPGAMQHLLPGLDLMNVLQMSAEEYCARVLGRFCDAAITRAESPGAMFVNYDRLPEALSAILKHFGVEFSVTDMERMNAAASFDAKTPGVTFTPDSERKRAGATDEARRAAALLEPLHQRLTML